MSGNEGTYNEYGQVVDVGLAQDLAKIEDKLRQPNLDEIQQKNIRLMLELRETYPDAFDVFIDNKGRIGMSLKDWDWQGQTKEHMIFTQEGSATITSKDKRVVYKDAGYTGVIDTIKKARSADFYKERAFSKSSMARIGNKHLQFEPEVQVSTYIGKPEVEVSVFPLVRDKIEETQVKQSGQNK